MGDDQKILAIAARRRRAAWYSVACIAPYVAFIAMLSADPADLAWRAEGSSISLAIYLAVFLFIWPVVVAVAFMRTPAGQGKTR